MKGHSPKDLYEAFEWGWLFWAGPPEILIADPERGFGGEGFLDRVSSLDICQRSTAAQAHWQIGKAERHQQTFKNL